MLTIQNVTKVWKHDVCGRRIGKIETLNDSYVFHLYRHDGNITKVNLSRKAINNNGSMEYALWRWNTQGSKEVLSFEKGLLETTDKFLSALNLLLM